MPLNRACAWRGCGVTIPRSARFCPTHQDSMQARELDRQRDVDRRRPRGRERSMYQTPEWRAASADFLAARQWCECADCRTRPEGRRASEVVDHVKPHRGDPGLFWDRRNWRPMAGSCHSRKTASEDGGFGNRRKAGA